MNAAADSLAETRRAFYDRIGHRNMTPLWLSLANLVTPEPRGDCRPANWKFADIRAAMMEAGSLIPAKEAERRVRFSSSDRPTRQALNLFREDRGNA